MSVAQKSRLFLLYILCVWGSYNENRLYFFLCISIFPTNKLYPFLAHSFPFKCPLHFKTAIISDSIRLSFLDLCFSMCFNLFEGKPQKLYSFELSRKSRRSRDKYFLSWFFMFFICLFVYYTVSLT